MSDQPTLDLVPIIVVGVLGWLLATWSHANSTRLRKELASALSAARRDSLTGLLNRLGCHEQAPGLLHDAITAGGSTLVVVLDLDHFKQVNDRYGHAAGDHLLREVADELVQVVSPDGLAIRLGGDEFAVILPCAGRDADPGWVSQAAADLTRRVRSRTKAALHQGINVEPSVGVVVAHDLAASMSTLLGQADAAMYCAKRSGLAWSLAPCGTKRPAAKAQAGSGNISDIPDPVRGSATSEGSRTKPSSPLIESVSPLPVTTTTRTDPWT